ncbi:MAG: hypothetical protein JKX73_01605 [Flavobacteriales bacterium]|nr:hypothetical protein [Flavobacteriales bacterium]
MIRNRKYSAKHFAGRAHLFALTILFLGLTATTVFSQETLYGFVKLSIDKGDLEGSNIAITKNGKPWKNANPTRAKYEFDLDYGHEYLFTFTKAGYITKKIIFNTKVPGERIVEGFVPFPFNVTLFKQYEGVNTVVFNQPVGKIGFFLESDDFDYDTDYTKSIQAALREVEEKIEEKRKEEEKAEQTAAKAAAQQAQAEEEKKKRAAEEEKKKQEVADDAVEAARKKAEAEEKSNKKT